MLLGIFCTVDCTLPFRKYIIHCSVVHAAQSIMEKPPLAVGDTDEAAQGMLASCISGYTSASLLWR